MQGTLELDSHEGPGTRFVLDLPAADPGPPAPEPTAEEPPAAVRLSP